MAYSNNKFVSLEEMDGRFIEKKQSDKRLPVADIVRGFFAEHAKIPYLIHPEDQDTARVTIDGKEAYIKRINGGFCASATNDFNRYSRAPHKLEVAEKQALTLLGLDNSL